jgi:polar amino acid transport system permease protein
MALNDTVNEAIAAPPPPPRKWTGARIAGYSLCAFWIIIAVLLAWSLISAYDPETFSRYAPRILEGLWLTVKIVVLSIAVGSLLSFPIALARISKSALLRNLSFGYVYFFRGTPLLAQLFLTYYGAGQFRESLEGVGLWWFFRDAFNCVMLAFTLNTAAYQAEILKGAIQSVPRGQTEAAMSLGLSRPVTFLKVILPQALITALRPLGNEVILMIKGSAVASVVTILDLMGTTKLAFSRTYDFNVYLWAALLYLSMVETLRYFWDRMEVYLTRHLRMPNEK